MLRVTRGTTGRVLTSGTPGDEASDLVRRALSNMASNRDLSPNQDIDWDTVSLEMAEARQVLIDEIKKGRFISIQGDIWRARTTFSLADHGIQRDENNKLQFTMSQVPPDYFHAAPANPQRQNRFHGPNEECLYVATEKEHLALEMAQDCLYGDCLLARFCLKEPYGRFLSILTADTPSPSGLNALAMDSERSRLSSLAAGQANPYVGTQWLRQLLEREFPDVHGIVYPPVHGSFTRNSTGKNIAVISDAARKHIYSCGPIEIIRRSIDVTWTEETWLW